MAANEKGGTGSGLPRKKNIMAVPENQTYLGDSVYAEHTGYYIVLTTNNGYPDDPRNRIALEPDVVIAFMKFLTQVAEKMKKP